MTSGERLESLSTLMKSIRGGSFSPFLWAARIAPELPLGDGVSSQLLRGLPGGGLPDGDGLPGLPEAAGSELAEREGR